MGRMTKCAHKPIVYDKLHGAKLDELIEYSNAMETRIHALIRAVKKTQTPNLMTISTVTHGPLTHHTILSDAMSSQVDP